MQIHIAETEWRVMQVLWENPMSTIGEVIKELKDTAWSDSTIKTMVRRLTKKEAVGIDSSGAQFLYYALVNEEECKKKETKHLIDRIYNGSLKMLMASLASDSNLTKEEQERIIEIIGKMEGGEDK